MKPRVVASIALALWTASCVNGGPSAQQAIVSQLESSLVLPPGAEALDRYNRYYEFSSKSIRGVLLQTTNTGQLKIVPEGRLPLDRRDGGCGVVHVEYDLIAKTWKPAICQQAA